MTLQEANHLLEGLKAAATKPSEIKVYEKFLHILNELENRGFSIDEMRSIETELGNLNLKSNPGNRKKYFNNALKQFNKFLKDTFSLTSKGYYTNLWIALGSSFGALFGVVILSGFERSLGICFGISIGLLIGLFVGQYLDAQAKAAGNLI